MRRVELLTPCLQGRCSPNWATPPNSVDSNKHRVDSLLRKSTICLLFTYFYLLERTTTSWQYTVNSNCCQVVGSSGLEPPTSRLSAECSNQLSYEPVEYDALPSTIYFSLFTWPASAATIGLPVSSRTLWPTVLWAQLAIQLVGQDYFSHYLHF